MSITKIKLKDGSVHEIHDPRLAEVVSQMRDMLDSIQSISGTSEQTSADLKTFTGDTHNRFTGITKDIKDFTGDTLDRRITGHTEGLFKRIDFESFTGDTLTKRITGHTSGFTKEVDFKAFTGETLDKRITGHTTGFTKDTDFKAFTGDTLTKRITGHTSGITTAFNEFTGNTLDQRITGKLTGYAKTDDLWKEVSGSVDTQLGGYAKTDDLWKNVSGSVNDKLTIYAKTDDLWKNVSGNVDTKLTGYTQKTEFTGFTGGKTSIDAHLSAYTKTDKMWEKVSGNVNTTLTGYTTKADFTGFTSGKTSISDHLSAYTKTDKMWEKVSGNVGTQLADYTKTQDLWSATSGEVASKLSGELTAYTKASAFSTYTGNTQSTINGLKEANQSTQDSVFDWSVLTSVTLTYTGATGVGTSAQRMTLYPCQSIEMNKAYKVEITNNSTGDKPTTIKVVKGMANVIAQSDNFRPGMPFVFETINLRPTRFTTQFAGGSSAQSEIPTIGLLSSYAKNGDTITIKIYEAPSVKSLAVS